MHITCCYKRTCPDTKRSYTREEKLKVTQWYWNNGQNLYQTCKKFEQNLKTVLRWITNERKIKNSSKGHKRVKFERTSQYPAMEDTLYKEYRSLWQGIEIKGWWFKARTKQLLQATQVESQFKFSNTRFDGFKWHFKISLRRPTNKAQYLSTDKRELICRKFCQEAAVGPQIGKLG